MLKAQEIKDLMLTGECVLDQYADTNHECVECQSRKRYIALDHRDDVVLVSKACIGKELQLYPLALMIGLQLITPNREIKIVAL